MLAPSSWSWAFYSIDHFDMLESVRESYNINREHDYEPDFVHNNISTSVRGWEDNQFNWLTAAQDERFAYPGRAYGFRSRSYFMSGSIVI
jgi:hypothetical protein